MNPDEDESAVLYKVVVNEEGQYSIWFADRDNPLGWTEEGTTGPKQKCLARISEIWTDMRPKSVREQLKALQGGAEPG
jgi:MbtH protein